MDSLGAAIITLLAVFGLLLAIYGNNILNWFAKTKAIPTLVNSHSDGIQRYVAVLILILVVNFGTYLAFFYLGMRGFTGQWPDFTIDARIITFQLGLTIAGWAAYKVGFFKLSPKDKPDAPASKTQADDSTAEAVAKESHSDATQEDKHNA